MGHTAAWRVLAFQLCGLKLCLLLCLCLLFRSHTFSKLNIQLNLRYLRTAEFALHGNQIARDLSWDVHIDMSAFWICRSDSRAKSLARFIRPYSLSQRKGLRKAQNVGMDVLGKCLWLSGILGDQIPGGWYPLPQLRCTGISELFQDCRGHAHSTHIPARPCKKYNA